MPPRAREVTQQDAPAGEEKRKPVRRPTRRDPEKRRQQNIAAQKRYREKLRERLERLEALAASAAESRGIPATSLGPLKPVSPQGSYRSSNNSTATNIPIAHTCAASTTVNFPPFGAEHQALVPQLDDIPLDLDLWDPSLYAPFPDDPSLFGMWDPTLTLQPEDTLWSPPATDQQSDSATSEGSILLPTNHFLQTAAQKDMSAVKYRKLKTKDQSPCQFPGDRPGSYWTTTIQCGCQHPHFQLQTSNPGSFNSGDVWLLSLEQNSHVPDPFTNNLRLDMVCNITALWAIGAHLGVSEEEVCEDDAISPFFQPGAEASDAVIKTTQALFKTLKYDLRPTKEQITISHHPFIDIFPFPTLRKNLITQAGEYDEDQFFHDTLTGLVCWGGTNIGKKDRNASTGKASTGTPWDSRSWEAHAWFVNKWYSLLGGEDGELVRQTEWWRSIRGEDAIDLVEV
ncbi:hypothetical protein BDV06DRAFT_195838 [Aspergillus oleicola]